MSSTPSCISIWNSSGVKNQKYSLQQFLKSNNIDFMIVTETLLAERDTFSIPGYTAVRRHKTDLYRGIAILIRKGITYTCIDTPDADLETVAITVNNITIVGVYRSPNGPPLMVAELMGLLALNNKVIIGGDLNAKHANWSCNRNNISGVRLAQYVDNHPDILLWYPNQPTHYPANGTTPTTIDIFVTKNSTLFDINTVADLDSDHNPVTAVIRELQSHVQPAKIITTYHNTDWQRFRSDLDAALQPLTSINTIEQLDSEVDKLTRVIQATARRHSQSLVIKQNSLELPYYIKQLITVKNRARERFQRTGRVEDRSEMNRTRAVARRAINTFRNQLWENKLSRLDTRDNSLWKFLRYTKRKSSYIPTLNSNPPAITEESKANLIANFIKGSQHIDHTNDSLEQRNITAAVVDRLLNIDDIPNRKWRRYRATTDEIVEILKGLPNNKAPGPDLIPNIVLKHLSFKAIASLTEIVNAILRLQRYPAKWKLATIIPVKKPNQPASSASSYRPISLLNGLAKVAEKVVANRLEKYSDRLITDNQYGFVKQRNATQLLTKLVHNIIEQFNKRGTCAMMALDISKAFDRVWVDGLGYKLMNTRIPIYLTRLLYNYCNDRKARVRVGATMSTTIDLETGVPQGSVLGPKLFLYYINDTPVGHNSTLAMYADDTAILSNSFHPDVANKKIQIHNRTLENFYNKWHININTDKTHNILFSRKMNYRTLHQHLKFGNQDIPRSDCIKYLGLHLDTRLRFRRNAQLQTNKARAAICKLFPLFKSNSVTIKIKRLMYKMLIRPILTYGCQIWGHISTTTLRKYQTTQNKCLRLILNKPIDTRVDLLHQLADIPTFSDYVHTLTTKYYNSHIQHHPSLSQLYRRTPSTHQYPNSHLDIPLAN